MFCSTMKNPCGTGVSLGGGFFKKSAQPLSSPDRVTLFVARTMLLVSTAPCGCVCFCVWKKLRPCRTYLIHVSIAGQLLSPYASGSVSSHPFPSSAS
jgi:hypothetical protein